MPLEPISLGYSVVLLGHFNPKILSPAWLKLQDLITDAEYEAHEIEVIHPDIAKFSIGILDIEVTTNRFICRTKSDPYARIYDFISKLFRTHLPHVPIGALGINSEIHFSVGSPEKRIELGRQIAPLMPWRSFGESISEARAGEPGGMASLTMRETVQYSDPFIRYDVTIEPSKLSSDNSIVFMRSNFHAQLKRKMDDEDVTGEIGSGPILDVLDENFEPAIKRGKAVFSEMADFASELNVR